MVGVIVLREEVLPAAARVTEVEVGSGVAGDFELAPLAVAAEVAGVVEVMGLLELLDVDEL